MYYSLIGGLFYWFFGIPVNVAYDHEQVYVSGDDGEVKALFDVEIANTGLLRAQGLSGREYLSDHEGMLFIFDEVSIRQFWMKGMLIPIDIIWIREGVIQGINSDAPVPLFGEYPAVFESPGGIDMVLEVRAGIVEDLDIQIGDRVGIVD